MEIEASARIAFFKRHRLREFRITLTDPHEQGRVDLETYVHQTNNIEAHLQQFIAEMFSEALIRS